MIIYRLATKGTVEEDLLSSAEAKRRLEKLVIRKGTLKTMGKKLGEELSEVDKEALRALLLKDGEVYRYSGSQEILSDADMTTLMDRYVPVTLIMTTGCVANVAVGVTPRTSRRRGETAMRMCSRSSRRGRMASRKRRLARRICIRELGLSTRGLGILPRSWMAVYLGLTFARYHVFAFE